MNGPSLFEDKEKWEQEVYAKADRKSAFWSGFVTGSAIMFLIFNFLFGVAKQLFK